MAKKIDYSTPEGIRAWREQTGYSSDSQAAVALGLPLRTYSRYKSCGLPGHNTAGQAIREFILGKMQEILETKP